MKLLINIGLLLLCVIIVQCISKRHGQSEEDCMYHNVIANVEYQIVWNTTYLPGHRVSLKILSGNINGVADNRNILVHIHDLQLQSGIAGFLSPKIGYLWVCIIINVEQGYERIQNKIIEWTVNPVKDF